MVIKSINAKSILSASKIYPYVINPYSGCQFGCVYCYARFMKKFTGHTQAWGQYVDVKINAAELLQKEIIKKKKDQVWISGVCDPYQPLERKYEITRECLQVLIKYEWPFVIQTKSSLAVRDIDLFKEAKDCDVGFSVTTADDKVRKIFEPKASSIQDRIDALEMLHKNGIRTYAMVAPMLPGCEKLVTLLEGIVDYIYVDKMNYWYAHHVYKKHGLERYCDPRYFYETSQDIVYRCKRAGIECMVCF